LNFYFFLTNSRKTSVPALTLQQQAQTTTTIQALHRENVVSRPAVKDRPLKSQKPMVTRK